MKDIWVEKINSRRSSVGNTLPQLVETVGKNEHLKTMSKISGTIPVTSSEKINHTTPAAGIGRFSYNVRPRLNTLPQRSLKNADAAYRTHLIKRSSSHEEPQTIVTGRTDNQLGENYNWNGHRKIPHRIVETGRRRWSKDSWTSQRRHSTDEAVKHYTINGNSSKIEAQYGTWASRNSHDGAKYLNDESLSPNPVTYLDSRNNSSSPTSRNIDSDNNDATLNKRRWSRPNFAITSRRVSLLLGWKKALHDPTKKNNTIRDTTHSTETKYELPKQPRFSSFMSPEAQYALMKGYEDKLHDKLSQTYPEYNGLLKRNKTPHSHINIRRKSCIGVLGDAEEEEEEEFVEIPINFDGDTFNRNETKYDNDKQNSQGTNDQAPTKEPSRLLAGITCLDHSFDSSSTKSEYHKAKPTDALKNLRRLSLSFVTSGNANNLFESDLEDETFNDIFSLQRQSSLPSLCSLPSDRRIMMSYRLESAMDILDTIRDKDEVPLSPRVKAKPRLCAPLPDYNTWASDWSREFKMKQGKA